MSFSGLRLLQHLVSFSFVCTLISTAYLTIKSYGTIAVLAAISAGEQIPADHLRELLAVLSTIESNAGIILTATIISMLIFFIWLYLCYKKTAGLTERKPAFSPAWAVAWFLIPVFNLYKPYLVIRELWQTAFHNTAQSSFLTRHGSLIIRLWWLTNVANQMISLMTNGAAAQARDLPDLPFAQVAQHYLTLMELITLSSLLSLIVTGGFVFLVFTITEALERRLDKT